MKFNLTGEQYKMDAMYLLFKQLEEIVEYVLPYNWFWLHFSELFSRIDTFSPAWLKIYEQEISIEPPKDRFNTLYTAVKSFSEVHKSFY